ncbi:MAG: hypothetical protein E7532_04510 [Ruminococcaceae bacterium]|nr:hypothetical protein [Oscillospiraceae bacterium]
MTGLDKILSQINLDADNTCAVIESRCQKECNEILQEAKLSAEKIKDEAQIKAKKNYDDIIRRAESSAELENRRVLLSARQSIISEMINNSLEKLLSLPDDEYFDVIYKLISKYSLNSDGVIAFNKKDNDRLPADFMNKVSEIGCGKLVLSDSYLNIRGGFVLSFGDIDINCSFDSLYQDNSELISDRVAAILFG